MQMYVQKDGMVFMNVTEIPASYTRYRIIRILL